jgi:hypothetical protein
VASAFGSGVLLFGTFAWSQSADDWHVRARDVCAGSTSGACATLGSVDPAVDGLDGTRAAFVAADAAARSLAPAMLQAVSRANQASDLRASPPVHDAASATTALSHLLESYVALLPARARHFTRGFSADTWWDDLARAESTPAWRRIVRDGSSPVGLARADLVRVAQLVGGVSNGSIETQDALARAGEIAQEAIARGAARPDVATAFGTMLGALPPRAVAHAAPENSDVPTRPQVVAAMDTIRAQVERCVGPQDGLVQLRIVFAHDGHVTDAGVQGTFAGTMAGSCVRNAALGLTVPVFTRDSFSVIYPFSVSGAHPHAATAQTPAEPTPVVATNDPPPPPPQPRPPPPEPAPSAPDRPAQVDIDGAMSAIAPAVNACVVPRRGPLLVDIEVSGDGEVQTAHARGHFNADALACVEQAVMNAHLPRFTGATVHFVQRFPIGRRR